MMRRFFLFVKVPTKIFFFFCSPRFLWWAPSRPFLAGNGSRLFYSSWLSKRGRKFSSIVIKGADLWAGTAIQHTPEKGKPYKDNCGRWRRLVCDGCITSSLDRHYEYGLVCSWAAAQEKRINPPATFTSILSSRVPLPLI
jgi:hypothetical protein